MKSSMLVQGDAKYADITQIKGPHIEAFRQSVNPKEPRKVLEAKRQALKDERRRWERGEN